MQDYTALLQRTRDAFNAGRTMSKEFRRRQLKNLLKLLYDNEDALITALHKDLRKPKQEAVLMEIELMKGAVKVALFNLDEWMKPRKADKTLVTMMETMFIHPEPYGVALVIGAWNYPLELTGSPLVGAISAGNCCVIKPSEISPNVAEVLCEQIPKYLDPDCYPVVLGGPEETSELLKQKFDYVFFTGSTHIGKIVREATNKYLTPCTLELGGKSPSYVADDADIEITAKRLIWGKLSNFGQTCIAPDYVLCSKNIQNVLIDEIKRVIRNWYGDDPKNSPDLGRIVNDRNYKRLVTMLKNSKADVVLGGVMDASERYISPTLLVNVTEEDSTMAEEIFGPILPFVNVDNAEEAIKFINKGEKPLTLYVFSRDNKTLMKFINKTSSGSVLGNDTLIHLSVESLPFGGVGMSGMGNYHGKNSFDTFSHFKSCLIRNFSGVGEYLAKGRYPPYSEKKIKHLSFILQKRKPLNIPYFTYILTFCFGVLMSVLISQIVNEAI